MRTPSDRTKALVLFALPLLIYGFGVGHEFLFDDRVYIAENPLLRRSDAFRVFWFSTESFNYYPLFWSLLRVQWLLWGDNALGYHCVTLLVHCANALLIWRIGCAWRLRGAWWVAALFAVHPVNVQTVAWAAEQKNTWSLLFMALACLAFIKHAETRDWRSYATSLICFVAALGCKTSTVALPVFLAICYGVRRQHRATVLLRLVPFFTAGAAAGLTTIWFEQHRVSARSLLSGLDLWHRSEAAGAAFWFYLEKASLPVNLTPMYRGWTDATAAAHSALPLVLLALLTAICAFAWRRIGPVVAAGFAYYLVMLLPLLGMFDTNYFVYSRIADHWQYHALPGLLFAVVAAAEAVAQRVPLLLRYSNRIAAVGVAALALLASMHFAHFSDARTLWTYVLSQNPDAWVAWYNLGNDHADQREHPQAIAAYRESIRLKPDYYRAHFNLANTLAAAQRFDEADREYLNARQLAPADADNYVNRGVVLLRTGRQDEATAEFAYALQLDPNKASAQANLAALHHQ